MARTKRQEAVVATSAEFVATEGGEDCGCPHQGRESPRRPEYLGWVVLGESGEKIAKVASRELAITAAVHHLVSHGLVAVQIRERYFGPEGEAREGPVETWEVSVRQV